MKQNYTQATNWFLLAANQNHAKAQYYLGEYYHREKCDFEEAVKWFKRAAAQGNADAQYWLGGCYEYGWGIAKNYAEAGKYYRKAAQKTLSSMGPLRALRLRKRD